jgi:translocation and assembly module TamB
MTFNKKKAALFALPAVGLLALALFFFSGQNAGVDFFRTTLEKTITGFPGWSLEADSYVGNPFAGFTAQNVRISYKDEEIAGAGSLSVSLSLISLLGGSSGIEKVTVKEAFLSASELFEAIKDTDIPPDSGGVSGDLPVVVLAPTRIFTPMGTLRADILRLTPGQDTVTFDGKGTFLGTHVEAGGSLAVENSILLTDSFLRAGDAVASLSGEAFPRFYLEGTAESLNLKKLSALLSLPVSMEGVICSTITASRPGGKLLVSGEGEIEKGNIGGLLTEGSFLWSADEKRATVSPLEARIFSSPAEGSLSAFFGAVPLAEINLGLKDVDFEEWTSFFSWLSFGKGSLSSLRIDLSGPFDRLDGAVSFNSPQAVLQGFPVTDLAGRLDLKDGRNIHVKASGAWLKSPFSAAAQVTLDEQDRTETLLSVKSEKLDLKTAGGAFMQGLEISGTGTGSLDVKYPFEGEMTLSGALAAPKLSLAGINAGKFTASFSIEKDILRLSKAALSLPCGGAVSGKGSLTGLSRDKPVLDLDGEGKNIGWAFIESLALPGASLGASGTAYLRWSVHSPLADPVAEFHLQGADAPLLPALPLRNIALRGRISQKEIALSEGSAALWGGRVRLSGKAATGGKKPALDFRGDFTGLALPEIMAASGFARESASGTLSGEFGLAGRGDAPSLSLSAAGEELSIVGIPLKAARARAEGVLPGIKLTSFTARAFNSDLSAEGTAELKRNGNVNFSAAISELDLRELASILLPGSALGGKVTGKATLKGSPGKPLSLTFSGTSPLVTLHGLLAEKVAFSLRPDGKGSYYLSGEGKVGESILSAEGQLVLTEEGSEIYLKNSRKIDLGATAAGLSAQASGIIAGEADFTAKGIFRGESPLWEGKITSERVGFYNTEINSVDLPFVWKEGRVTIPRGIADYHGGAASFSGSADTGAMRWEGELTVKGMDLAKATEKILGDRGSVKGEADLTVKGNGTGGMVGMVFGSGRLSAKEGSLSGFDALKTVSDSGTVNFSSVLASFNLDGRSIFLLPGSRVSAPVGDSIYRYFTASGSLGWGSTPLDLKCGGDINVRALNAFLGALQGIIAVDGNPLTDPAFLQKFLTGLLGGMSVRDFRETTFNLKGTWDSPMLTDLKVTSAAAPAAIPRPDGPGRNETQIKIRVEIPTGEGKETGSSTEDQVKKQLLENIMKQIIRPGGEDHDPVN